jgi:uncharacterized protein YjcR
MAATSKAFSPEKIERVRLDYLNSSYTLLDIARKYTIRVALIHSWASKFEWPKRPHINNEILANSPKVIRMDGNLDDVPSIPRLGNW